MNGRATSRDLDAIPHNLDGAEQHRSKLGVLRRLKGEDKDRRRKKKLDDEFYKMVDRLSALARTPISYAPDDTVPVVHEQSMYAGLAGPFRQHDLAESAVFDFVAGLSRLVQESRTILPKLTPDAVKQFEARIIARLLPRTGGRAT